MTIEEYRRLDATAAAEAIRSGTIAPTELVEAAAAAVEELNPSLNAVVSECIDRALGEAEVVDRSLPFAGVPLLVKDNHDCIGLPTRHASRYFAETGDATRDHAIVRRLRLAGFVPIGKTNMPEMGLQAATEPELYGPAHNPWDNARTCGGSSGGSAAAVAAGIVPVGTASDGGGSIRIPAAACGAVGLKPSRGRTPGLGWGGLAVGGVITRSLRDTAGVLDVLSHPGPDHAGLGPPPAGRFLEALPERLPRLRIGVFRGFGFGEPEAEVWSAVLDTATALSELGHEVSEAELDVRSGRFGELIDHIHAIVPAAMARQVQIWEHTTGRPATAEDFEALTWLYIENGRLIPATQYLAGFDALSVLTDEVAPVLDRFDVLLAPTVAQAAPLLGSWTFPAENPMSGWEEMGKFMPPFLTQLANYLGVPAISLPLHRTAAGLPIGSQLYGHFGTEATLLSLAAELEPLRPIVDGTALS